MLIAIARMLQRLQTTARLLLITFYDILTALTRGAWTAVVSAAAHVAAIREMVNYQLLHRVTLCLRFCCRSTVDLIQILHHVAVSATI